MRKSGNSRFSIICTVVEPQFGSILEGMKKKAVKVHTTPSPEPYTFEQLVDGQGAFIHPSGEHMYQVCCDCGSAHSIKLTVVSADEIEVLFFKHQALTKAARAKKGNTNGILVDAEVYEALISFAEGLGRGAAFRRLPKKLQREIQVLGRGALNKQRSFEELVKSGDFLS